jgi:hypothetical protein
LFQYTNTDDTRVDVSSSAHKGWDPALGVGKNLTIRHPNLCTLTHVHAAPLGIVGGLKETIGLRAGIG